MKIRNLRSTFLVATLALAGFAMSAHAQFSVYGMVQGENLKDITCLDPQNTCASANGTAKPYGGVVGATYDFKRFGPITLGGDLRGSFMNSNKNAYYYQASGALVRHYSALAGVRATFHTPFKVLRPYAQISGGLANTNATKPAANNITVLSYQNFGQVQGFVGLDLALFPLLDFRPIELGAGEIFGANSHSIQTIGIGIVFHTPRSKK